MLVISFWKEPAKMEDGFSFWKLCIASGGSVAGLSDGNGTWILDRETGEPLKQVDPEYLLDIAVCGNELLLFEEQAVRRYDLAAETALERDAVLEQTHRCLCGEIGAAEAVNVMLQKINLYLAE